jgi:hypothetical protein
VVGWVAGVAPSLLAAVWVTPQVTCSVPHTHHRLDARLPLLSTAHTHPPQGEAIAYNLREMFGLRVPVISVVIGEGGSGGALAIGCANRNLIMENAVYYVASPEACAAILWKSRAASSQVGGSAVSGARARVAPAVGCWMTKRGCRGWQQLGHKGCVTAG